MGMDQSLRSILDESDTQRISQGYRNHRTHRPRMVAQYSLSW